MSLELELTRLEPGDLVAAVQNCDINDPELFNSIYGRFKSLATLRYLLANCVEVFPLKTNLATAGAASLLLCIGLVRQAEGELEIAELQGDSGQPHQHSLHKELSELTGEDIEAGIDAAAAAPLWRADHETVDAFYSWYPSIFTLIKQSAASMVTQGQGVQEILSLINGGLISGQILVAASVAHQQTKPSAG